MLSTTDSYQEMTQVQSPLSTNDIRAIRTCLNSGLPVYVDKANQVHYYLSGLDRFFYSIGAIHSTEKQNSDERLALLLQETLLCDGAEKKPVIEACKAFLHHTVLKNKNSLDQLKRQLIATKLGLSAEILAANPDFQFFAEVSHLHHSLRHFQHTLKVENQKIFILHQNQMTDWSTLKDQITYKNGKWCGHYSQNGVETKNFFEWTHLTACMSGDPSEWGNQYVFKFVVWHKEKSDQPTPTGVHTYCHLLTPDQKDNIFSFGFYRPDKRDDLASLMYPLRVRKGDIQCPDESDSWNGSFSTLSVAITKEQFEAVKKRVEEDHHDLKPYHLTHRNCNEYTLELARLCGINMTSFLPISRLILPISEKTLEKIPAPLRNMTNKITSIAINIVGVCFAGSRKVDQDAPAQSEPHIASIGDIFKEEKALFSHPYILENGFNEIMTWRDQESRKRPTERDMIAYALPDRYKIHVD